jgi:hypothetical protein
MRKRHYGILAAGLTIIISAFTVASVASAQGSTPTPQSPVNILRTVAKVARRLGNTAILQAQMTQGADLHVLSINGQTIYAQGKAAIIKVVTDEKTTFQLAGQPASLKDISVGTEIRVKGQRRDDGSLAATSVQIIPPHASGQVSNISQGSLTLKQGSQTQVVQLTSNTSYYLKNQKASADVVKAGRTVEVAGTLTTDGTLSALVVRVQPDRAAGRVSSISGSTITLSHGVWTLPVATDANTTYLRGQEKVAATDIKVGDNVTVEGFKNADGSITAATIHLTVPPTKRVPKQQSTPTPTPASGQS